MKRRKFLCLLGFACAAMSNGLPWANAGELSDAAASGDLPKIRSLLQAGAAVDGRDRPADPTALMVAAGGGAVDVVRFLLEKGANASGDAHSPGDTPLSLAAHDAME